MTTIHHAHYEDLRRILPVVREALAEVQYQEPMTEGLFAMKWVGLMESGKAITLTAENDGKVAGVLLGMVCQDMFAPVTFATDLLWYVRPGYRRHGIGKALAREYEAVARNKGCKRAVLGAWEKFSPEATVSSLSRMGYRPLERYMIKEL